MSNTEICNCYHSLWKLYDDYKKKNKQLTWTSENERIFIDEVRQNLNCVMKILLYLEKMQKTTNAEKSEFKMLYDILQKYNTELKQKANYIEQRLNKRNASKMLAVDDFQKLIDNQYNATYLKKVLPNCPSQGGKIKTQMRQIVSPLLSS